MSWKTETRKLGDLKKWDKNPRTLGKKEYERLKKKIVDQGFHDVLIIDTDNTILSGNQRKTALEELGVTEVECMVPERKLTDAERDAVAISANLHEGEWDFDILANQFDLPMLVDQGFTNIDLGLGGKEEDDFDIDKAFEAEPISQLGDIYQLGDHRVMCGDSTKREDVEKLMDGKKADMVFTDPPYGVNYTGKAERLGRKGQSQISGDADVEEASTVYGAVFQNISDNIRDGAEYYVCAPQGGDQEMMMMMMMRSTIPCRHQLIWKKDSPVFSMGRLDYDYQHEPILYGWRGSHKHHGAGKFKTSIWEIPRPKVSKLHPTMKPVELIEEAILNGSLPNEIVMDLFLGSGSSLIAAEKTGRICVGSEIDPKYIDVIIRRFIQYNPEAEIKCLTREVDMNLFK